MGKRRTWPWAYKIVTFFKLLEYLLIESLEIVNFFNLPCLGFAKGNCSVEVI